MPTNARAARRGSTVTKRTFLNARVNVAGQVIVEHSVVLAEEHVGQFMAFESAEQQ